MPDLADTQIQGRQSNGNAQEEAARKLRSESSGLYSHGTATIATAQTNRAWSTDDADFFTQHEGNLVNFFEIFSDAAITIAVRTRQNAAIATATLDDINIRANTLRTFDFISDITEIFITNASGGNAAVEITGI